MHRLDHGHRARAGPGRRIEMRSIDIWRVENGMFAEHWDELNTLQVFQQMGAIGGAA